jgi:hypothetical protein
MSPRRIVFEGARMPTQARVRHASAGERVVATYRQAWLAGLGAAALTRDWIETGAAPMLRTLVKEGTLVEAKAMRVVEARVESSYALASTAWRRARREADAAIREARTLVPAALARLPLPSRVAALVTPATVEVAPARARKSARPARKPRAKPAAATRRTRKRA